MSQSVSICFNIDISDSEGEVGCGIVDLTAEGVGQRRKRGGYGCSDYERIVVVSIAVAKRGVCGDCKSRSRLERVRICETSDTDTARRTAL